VRVTPGLAVGGVDVLSDAPVPGVPDAAWQGHVVRLPAAEGEEPSALAVVWDVTARRRAELALEAANAELREADRR